MMAVKLCKDCRFSYKPWLQAYQCHHPEIGPMAGRIDPVEGKYSPSGYWFCDTNRMAIHSDKCGPNGNKWEAK